VRSPKEFTVGNSRGELEELVTLQAWVERRSWWKWLLAEGQAASLEGIPTMMSGSLSSLFQARYPALACGSDCRLSPHDLLLLVVTLVAYLLMVLHKVTVKGQVFTVPRIDIGQTHSGSLEGIPMIMCGSLHQGVSPLSRSSM
jgi:hypothetical protein